MDTIKARWTKNRQFVGWDSANHGIVLDTPESVGGERTGWRPLELILLGLAGCSGIDVLSILEKKREDVREFEIVVDGDMYLDDYPHYYKTINITYQVTGVNVKPESVARAIELSIEKYCSVSACLGPQCVVSTHFEITAFNPRISAGE